MTGRAVAGRCAWLCAAPLLVAMACGHAGPERATALVFAAASLTASFEALAGEFERRHPGSDIELHFDGTPRLALQLREGAPADVFASADRTNMQRVVDTGTAIGEPVVFATNRLAIVTQRGNPHGIRGLADLARADLRVVLCGPEVPAGRYAREALAKAGVAVRSVSDEPSVKAVVSKVALGEVDAGIVYATDATGAAAPVEAVALPGEHDVVASYPIVLLTAGRDRATGAAFLEFVRSADGQAILGRFGFSPP
ncbi:MAG: molybdate ABC transporter substrate-binding protein [Planctomycetes bacterium]|nr:molybdate ABC transporter substrate-binding protein [Planctomycetota bacterium]